MPKKIAEQFFWRLPDGFIVRTGRTDGRTRYGIKFPEQHPIKYVEQHPIKYVAPLIRTRIRIRIRVRNSWQNA